MDATTPTETSRTDQGRTPNTVNLERLQTLGMCALAESTLILAGQLIEALQAGRRFFPEEAKPIVDDLAQRYAASAVTTRKAIAGARAA